MTACFRHGSCALACAFADACSDFTACCAASWARHGVAARQRPRVTIEKKNLTRFNTAALPVCATSQLRHSRLCVFMNLQLFRQFKLALRVFRAAKLAVSLPEQMVGHRVIGIHGDGAL